MLTVTFSVNSRNTKLDEDGLIQTFRELLVTNKIVDDDATLNERKAGKTII